MSAERITRSKLQQSHHRTSFITKEGKKNIEKTQGKRNRETG